MDRLCVVTTSSMAIFVDSSSKITSLGRKEKSLEELQKKKIAGRKWSYGSATHLLHQNQAKFAGNVGGLWVQ